MNEYVNYRNWWMKYARGDWPCLPEVWVNLGQYDRHEAFKNHINSMTLYELMETLEGFGEEDNDEYAAGSETEKLMLEMFDDV